MKKAIVFVQPTDSTFMDIDYRILSSQYTVYKFDLCQNSKTQYIFKMLRLVLWSVFNSNKFDSYVVWFADYHVLIPAFLKSVLRKKLVIFIGGYDAYSYPELHMGVYLNPLRGAIARFALRNADLIIANHESLIQSTHYYLDDKGHRDGILNLIPGLKTPYSIVFNGFEPPYEIPVTDSRENIIITVGTTPTWNDVINKGYDLMITAAKAMPEFQFIFVGLQSQWLDKLEELYHYRACQNLRIIPHLPHNELLRLYTRCRIFVQPSIIEGMPNALLEAMYYECIPVGSNVAGIPLVIGNTGVIIEKRDAALLIKAIQSAALMHTEKECRARITTHFSFQNRKTGLLQAINNIEQSV